jgi:hypothetical protein
MGVDITWRNARGEPLEQVGDSDGFLAAAIARAHQAPRDFPLLTTIDVYGDGLIMPPKTSAFRSELETIRDNTADVDARIQLGKLISLARSVDTAPGSYLEYMGD